MNKIRKTPTQKEMIEEIQRDKLSLPPLSFLFKTAYPEVGGGRHLDALIEASWRDKTALFAIECKSISTPKAFQDGLSLLKSVSLPRGWYPMLFLPFLSEQQLQELEREGISGIDLSGNGVVIVSGRFAIFRSGNKNRFPSSAAIKNIYRKNSSMVARVFLVRPRYEAVQEISAEINQRNILVKSWDKKPMSLSTVSKALNSLEQDLIIERKDTIRLLQADKLLEKLTDNYEPPKIRDRVRLKIPETSDKIHELLFRQSQELGMPFVITGTSSVAQYAVMQRGDLLSVYCPRLEIVLDRLSGSQSDRFPNLELIETEDETVYFDARQDGNSWWVSPVQTYLELMAGDKRDQETAEQLKELLLTNLSEEQR